LFFKAFIFTRTSFGQDALINLKKLFNQGDYFTLSLHYYFLMIYSHGQNDIIQYDYAFFAYLFILFHEDRDGEVSVRTKPVAVDKTLNAQKLSLKIK